MVPLEQTNLFDDYHSISEEKRKELFIAEVLKHQQWKPSRGSALAITGVSALQNDRYRGKFAKKQKQKNRQLELEKEDIEEKDAVDWPYSEFICDTKIQLFSVHRNSSISFDAKHIENLLNERFSSVFKPHGYKVIFRALVEEAEFWDTVKRAERVYSVRLELNSPNIVWGGAADIGKELKRLKKETNTSSTTIELNNELGHLLLKSSELRPYIEWVDRGNGSWFLKVKFPGSSSPESISSAGRAALLSLQFEDQATDEQLVETIKKFIPLIKEGMFSD